ncbi:MAG: SOS response-associated peptidase [Bacteroidota bacterium]
MCGRYSFTQSTLPGEIVQPENLEIEVKARYNIAPSQFCPIIPQTDPERVHFFRWGLVPHWAQDVSIGNKMINARGETLTEKPAFRDAFQRNRCLVLADGFYEWKKTATGKQPYRIGLSSEEAFYFAGLSSIWQHPSGELLPTFTIITTRPNTLVEDIHNRMPVILPKKQLASWMDPSAKTEDLQELLLPYPAEQMKAYPVARQLGNVRNDHPGLIRPYEPPLTLF